MQRIKFISCSYYPFILLVLGFLLGVTSVAAESTPIVRQTTITISYTEYEWWLLNWQDNSILCQMYIDHEGLPTIDDVLNQCGYVVYQQWQATPPCDLTTSNGKNKEQTTCKGVYLHQINFQPKTKNLVINLPSTSATITLEDCTLVPPENRCNSLPKLIIKGKEPLPNEAITAIEGTFDGLAFSCPGDSCAIPLQATPLDGINVEFWTVSSFGDTSEHYTARIRVIDAGVPVSPDSGGWFIDILSTQWTGESPASCSQTWDVFQPIGGPPSWLSTPKQYELIASNQAYYYLAGRLIHQGTVSATECPFGGLLPNGYANACGLEKSKTLVESWQNQFDQQILQVAQEKGIPAQLLKNIFAQESQFWPGVYRVPYEFGLGQITDNGADAILLWDENFYNQFCPLILLQEACDQGYLHLSPDDQAILRGALASQAKSDCSECPTGLNLTNVNYSVELFADTLLANCDQVAQIIYNATKETPGTISSYEDLWRFTIANYHAGPGCLSYAIYMAWSKSGELTWEDVAAELTEPCKGVKPYVEKITR